MSIPWSANHIVVVCPTTLEWGSCPPPRVDPFLPWGGSLRVPGGARLAHCAHNWGHGGSLMPPYVDLGSKACEQCGQCFTRGRLRGGRPEQVADFLKRRFCSRSCYAAWHTGEHHHNWHGGIRRGHNWGYLRYTDGSYVHRRVMEEVLGRPLSSDEHVHHINGDVTDNRPENLELKSNSEHRILHAGEQLRRSDGRFVAA